MAMPERDAATPPETHLRDHLANERTLLSWVRLGLSSAGFGFVVARFGLFLRQSALSAAATPTQGRFTEYVGVALILLGPVVVVAAALRFFQIERGLVTGQHTRRYGLIWSVIGASILLGIVLAGYLVLTGR